MTALGVGAPVLPLVAVLYRAPLFVEAVAAAFAGIADVRAVRHDDGDVAGLLEALRADAVVVQDEGDASFEARVPAIFVDLESSAVRVRRNGAWLHVGVDLSAEAIRNALLRAMVGGDR